MDDTVAVIGLNWPFKLPSDTVIIDGGKLVLDANTGDLLFEAGTTR